jgi:hypothetical protein
MTAPERVALLRELYEAFNQRDIEAVLAHLDVDVDWPNVLEGTRAVGQKAVREYWVRQFAQIDPHVEPAGFTARGEDILVSVHQGVRDLEGKVLRESDVVHAYTFRDRLVARMEVYPTIEAALGAA